MKSCSRSEFAFHAKKSSMGFDDFRYGDQAKPGSFPRSFGREERIEDLFKHSFRDSRSGVRHADAQVSPNFGVTSAALYC